MRLLVSLRIALTLTSGFILSGAHAQEELVPNDSLLDDDRVIEEITVQAARLRHRVEGYIDPEVSYDEEDIRSFAVNSLSELLEELAPELGSGRGRQNGPPVVLVNGQRTAGFREVRNYPTEAVERVEVYPEEVALQYGYRADQKVINFILKQNFRATTTHLSTEATEQVDAESGRLTGGYLRLAEPSRINISFTTQYDQKLHETDRSIQRLISSRPSSTQGNLFAATELDTELSNLVGQPVTSATLPDDPSNFTPEDLASTANQPESLDERKYRTLIPEQRNHRIAASYTTPLNQAISATFSSEYQRTDSESEQGALSAVYEVPADHPFSPFESDVELRRGYPSPLDREQHATAFEASGTLNAKIGHGSLTWINRFNKTSRESHISRGLDLTEFLSNLDASEDPFSGPTQISLVNDEDDFDSTELSSRAVIRGIIGQTPHGVIHGAATVGWSQTRRKTKRLSEGTLTTQDLDRTLTTARLNVDLPLIDHEKWGQIALNANMERSDYSDFNALNSFGGGITWRPNQTIRVTTSWTQEDGAPSITQLSDPVSIFVNRRLFDYRSGTSTNVQLISGGNQELADDSRRVFSINANIEPFDTHDAAINLSFVDSRIDNPIQTFFTPNAELELAFPDRFTRNAEGTLIAFDTRPLNAHQEHRQEVRWSLRYSRTFRSAVRPNRFADGRGTKPREGRPTRQRTGRQASGRWGGWSGQRRGIGLRFSLHHTYTRKNELILAPGIPATDYVGVVNAQQQQGGAEHQFALRSSLRFQPFVTRLNLRWRDERQSLPGSFGTLTYEPSFNADLFLVYTTPPRSALAQRLPILSRARMSFSILNLLDDKPIVRDQLGITPVGFEEDALNPRGRMYRLEFRKLFR